MKDEKVMVSICCAVYNQKKFISQALNSFLNQKTDFIFEILVNDDASTDGTKDILKEYELKYPEIIKVVYQKENQYSQGKKIVMDLLFPRVKGKYIALCEGDDYWGDEYKLQSQFDALERNKDCIISVHDVHDVSENGTLLSNIYPDITIEQTVIKTNEFFHMTLNPYKYLFHTSSFFFQKNCILELKNAMPVFIQESGVGDVPLIWFLVNKGNIYYINKIMSFYRRDTSGSWSKRMQNREYRKKIIKQNLNLFREFNKFTNYMYDDLINNDILKLEFDYLRLSNQFFKMRNKKYKNYYERISIIYKTMYFFLYIFPSLEKIYERINK